ncbi:MAG TPA: isoprenylcysteine carboxylmethyltransferase family protein [Thermoanaerobaculia bacterium]|nr:isoprenylcysteine carboxylmethyltransferase family protein [Thermoanaerobaculia bacterium]
MSHAAEFDSRLAFFVLVVLVALLRLFELRIAARNRRRLLARGAREAGAGHYPWMVTLHAVWLVAAPAEVWLLGRPFLPALAFPMLALLLLATALRWWVIATLGERWTTRILVLPEAPLVTGGPYRFLRHPNYLAVVLELAALPLVHTAWLTALLAAVSNAAILRVRITVEERALASASR